MVPDGPSVLKEEAALNIWIEEYKALSADVQSRVVLQHGLLNLQILFLAAIIALIATTVKEGIDPFSRTEINFCILLLPIILSFFVWRHLNHDVNIIDKAKYIYSVIRPNIIALSDAHNVLAFENFLEDCRSNRTSNFGVLIWLGGEHFFHLLFSIIFLFLAYISFSLNFGNLVLDSSVRARLWLISQIVLLILATLSILGTLRLRYKVSTAYASIIDKQVKPFP